MDCQVEKFVAALPKYYGQSRQWWTTTQVIQMRWERDTGRGEKLRSAVVAHREGVTTNETSQRLVVLGQFTRRKRATVRPDQTPKRSLAVTGCLRE